MVIEHGRAALLQCLTLYTCMFHLIDIEYVSWEVETGLLIWAKPEKGRHRKLQFSLHPRQKQMYNGGMTGEQDKRTES